MGQNCGIAQLPYSPLVVGTGIVLLTVLFAQVTKVIINWTSSRLKL